MSHKPLAMVLVIVVASLNSSTSNSSISAFPVGIEDDDNSFLAIPHYAGIDKFSIRNNTLLPGIKYLKLDLYTAALTFDWTRQTFFYLFESIIRIVPFNATNERVNPQDLAIVKTVKTKALAWYFEHMERYLYVFYDSDKVVTRFDPYIGDEGQDLILRLGESDVINRIVVDPCESKIYWLNFGKNIIQRASTTGLNRNIETIIETENKERRYLGLTIDPFKKELFWSNHDGAWGSIERSDLNGQNRVIITTNQREGDPRYHGIAVTKEFIYYRASWSSKIYRVNRNESNGTVTVVKKDVSSGVNDNIVYANRQIESRHQCVVWRLGLRQWNANGHAAKEKFTFGLGQQNGSLFCGYAMDIDTRVKWLHNDKSIDLDGVTIHTKEFGPGENSVSRLTFERMRLSDEGNYTCQVTTRHIEESLQFMVEICSSCVPKIDKSESKKVFTEGAEAQVLTCKYNTTSQPNVTWTQNGQTVLQWIRTYNGTVGESLIRFAKINFDDGGIYTCSVVNAFGEDFFEINVQIVTVGNRSEIIYALTITGVVIPALILTLRLLRRKYIGKKRIILKLTDGEVKEFFEGKSEALASNSNDCGNSIALATPFDPKNEMSMDDLIIGSGALLGEGQFGLVLQGSYHDRAVAVKTVKPSSDVAYLKALLSEIKIMAFIGNHQGIVEFLGAHTSKIQENVVYLVVELSPIGDLHSYLQRNRPSFLEYVDKVTENIYENVKRPMNQNHFVNWSMQIADGMKYLKGKKVVHADLATRNVLMFPDDVVKIADFGLSRQLYGYTKYVKKSKSPLPFRWMALESLRFMEFTSQSDVWSFGVTIWEIFSLGQVPYPEFNWSANFVKLLVQGLRLSKPDYATVEIYEEMLNCWDPVPEKRATFEQLLDFFQRLLPNDLRENVHDEPACEGNYVESEEVMAPNVDACRSSDDQPSAPLDRCLVFASDSGSSSEYGGNSAIYLSV